MLGGELARWLMRLQWAATANDSRSHWRKSSEASRRSSHRRFHCLDFSSKPEFSTESGIHYTTKKWLFLTKGLYGISFLRKHSINITVHMVLWYQEIGII